MLALEPIFAVTRDALAVVACGSYIALGYVFRLMISTRWEDRAAMWVVDAAIALGSLLFAVGCFWFGEIGLGAAFLGLTALFGGFMEYDRRRWVNRRAVRGHAA